MTNTLTNRQITSHIKKELLKKYPGITKLSVTGSLRVEYQGGCNETEMHGYLKQYASGYYDIEADIYGHNRKSITIDDVEYSLNIDDCSSSRTLNQAQAQTILELIKGFTKANKAAINLELYQSDYDGSWSLLFSRNNPRQVIVENGDRYYSTPELSPLLGLMTSICEPGSRNITTQSLYDAINGVISF